jgi:hypothetical protein
MHPLQLKTPPTRTPHHRHRRHPPPQMSTAEGQSYCTRKVTKLQDSLRNVQKILQERQAMLNQVRRCSEVC